MPKESGYFEETVQLHEDGDPFIHRTANLLHKHMRTKYLVGATVPLAGFNIFYFMQSTIRAWLGVEPGLRLSSKSFPYPCERIKAVNWPDRTRSKTPWLSPPLIVRYLEIVSEDSDLAGDDFDVSYALETLIGTLPADRLVRTAHEWSEQPTPDLGPTPGSEEWAAGFVCDEDS